MLSIMLANVHTMLVHVQVVDDDHHVNINIVLLYHRNPNTSQEPVSLKKCSYLSKLLPCKWEFVQQKKERKKKRLGWRIRVSIPVPLAC